MDCLIAIFIALLGLLLIWYVFVSISSHSAKDVSSGVLDKAAVGHAAVAGGRAGKRHNGGGGSAATTTTTPSSSRGGARRVHDDGGVAAAPQKDNDRALHRDDDDDDDDVLDALVAREVRRNPTGMSVDSKTLQPSALELTSHARTGKADGRRQAAVPEIDERTVRIDRELGFQTVGVSLRANNNNNNGNGGNNGGKKKKKSAQQRQQQQQQEEEEERPRRQKQRGAHVAESDEEMERKLSNFFRSSARKSGKSAAATAVGKLSFDDERVNAGSGGRVVIKRDITNARSW